MAQDEIDQTIAFPLLGAALNPDLVGITPGPQHYAHGRHHNHRSIHRRFPAKDYINNLRVNDPIVINEIAAAIRNSSSKILDVGAPNRQIEEIVFAP